MWSHRLVALALVGTTAAPACSLVAVKRVPGDWEPGDYLECTDGIAYPATDGAVTVLSGILAVNLFAAAGNRDEDESGLVAGGYVSAGLAAAFLASAAYGAIHVNRCRDAKNRAGPPPKKDLVIDRPPPGTLGGPCLDDETCEGELICDDAMKTCVPITPTDEDL